MSTTATLTSNCATGVEDQTASASSHLVTAFLTPGTTILSGNYSMSTYRVTLASDSDAHAEVTEPAAVFYGSRSETGCDRQGGFDSFNPLASLSSGHKLPGGAVRNAPLPPVRPAPLWAIDLSGR